MNRYKENKLSMYLALLAWYELHKTEADAIYKFKAIMLLITADVISIGNLRALQESDITGVAKDKKQTRELLEIAVMQVVVRLKSHATHGGLPELLAQVNFSMSDFRNAADTVMKDRCALILQIGTDTMPDMDPDLGLTQAMLDNLSALNTKYFSLIPMPRLKISERKNLKEQIDALFGKVDANLKLLDTSIDVIKYDNRALWDSYDNIRQIVDLKGKGKTVVKQIKQGCEGQVTDFDTDLPLHNAKVTANTTTDVVMSDEQGYFQIGLPVGQSTLKVEYAGRTTYTEVITVEEGFIVENDIELETPESDADDTSPEGTPGT